MGCYTVLTETSQLGLAPTLMCVSLPIACPFTAHIHVY